MSERKELFDNWAEAYDESMEDTAGFPFEGYQTVLGKVVGEAEVGDGASVLDVGIGTGALAARFAELGCRVLGVDLSEKMLVQARRNVPEADFRQLDLLGEWGDLEAHRFAAIVSAYVFHEFELGMKLELLTRFTGLLGPGGRIVVGDVSFETAQARAAAQQTWAEVWDKSEHYWAAEEVLPALEQRGLSVTYVQVSFCAGIYTICT